MTRDAVDTFVAVEARLNVDEKETGEWLVGKAGVAVEVKELNCSFFWIKPISAMDFQRTLQPIKLLEGFPIRRIDRWTEVLGPNFRSCWV